MLRMDYIIYEPFNLHPNSHPPGESPLCCHPPHLVRSAVPERFGGKSTPRGSLWPKLYEDDFRQTPAKVKEVALEEKC